MSPLHLAADEARRIAIRAARLDARPIDDQFALVRDLAMVRVDLTSTVAPSADHIAWARLGDAYRPGDLDRALADGELFERDWMLRPIEHLSLFTAGMRTWADRSGARPWMEANDEFRTAILDRIGDEGPLTSRDIPDESVVPRASSGWSNNRNVTTMLQYMHMVGDLAVVGRIGRLRVWDLAERVFPAVEEVPLHEARRIRSEHILAALGIARDGTSISPGELHNVELVGEEATIEGVPGRWRVDPTQLDRPFEGRTAILSPFDRLVVDRERIAHLFDFDYALEMYKPAEQRLWGKFALPILCGDRLVGKVDAQSEPKKGRFVINAIHEDQPFTKTMRADVAAEVDALAAWLRLHVTAP